jgi:hypothetical protein
MKKVEVKTEKTFDVELAEKRMLEIKSKNSKLNQSIDYKQLQGTQKLLQKISHNVSINKKSEIQVRLDRDLCTIRYIYDIEKKYSLSIEISFLKKYDTHKYSSRVGTDKKEGDFKKINFNNVGIDLSEGDSIEDFDCVVLYGYIAKEFRDNGDFILSLKSIYDDLRVTWDEIEGLLSEYHDLNSKKENHFKALYEKEYRDNNWIKEGNVIIIRDIKKDFVEATVYEINKVQKTTYYSNYNRIKIDYLMRTPKNKKIERLYALKVETPYELKNKRSDIDAKISSMASARYRGDKVELITSEQWEKMKADIRKEWEAIGESKLDEKSEMYRAIKYKMDDN